MNRLFASRRHLILGATGAATGAIAFYAGVKSRSREHPFKSMNGATGYVKELPSNVIEIRQNHGPFGVGDERVKRVLVLPDEEIEAKLSQDVSSVKVERTGNMVVGWDTACLPANKPNEDRMAVDIIPRAKLGELASSDTFWQTWGDVRKSILRPDKGQAEKGDGGGDLMMFSVLDGHGRHYDVSDLLKKVLHPTLAFALGCRALSDHNDQSVSWMSTISAAMQALDGDILRMPLTILSRYLGDPDKSPLLPSPAPSLISLANLEARGSCATTMIVDIATDKLYVANLGDCRAVAGWWNPVLGSWRCDVLSGSGDMNAQNPSDAEYIRSQHPGEHDTAICDLGYDARVLGLCAVTRAFGNSAQKHSTDVNRALDDVFSVEYQPLAVPYLTPPYIDNHPEVVQRDLHPAGDEELKFVILATDGLWARMTSEEASLLLTAHLDESTKQGSPITKANLARLHPYSPSVEPRPWPAQDLPGTNAGDETDTWTFGDENAALHLIRNSLGPGNTDERKWRLSADLRSYRDDASAMVVFFNESDVPPTATEII